MPVIQVQKCEDPKTEDEDCGRSRLYSARQDKKRSRSRSRSLIRSASIIGSRILEVPNAMVGLIPEASRPAGHRLPHADRDPFRGPAPLPSTNRFCCTKRSVQTPAFGFVSTVCYWDGTWVNPRGMSVLPSASLVGDWTSRTPFFGSSFDASTAMTRSVKSRSTVLSSSWAEDATLAMWTRGQSRLAHSWDETS